ncbi:MAG TPA: hypothetical protein VN778_04570 [Verrucomicrobiae bacterium]|nr:hypothetical protein [Verrucomicrobiae bacterium]
MSKSRETNPPQPEAEFPEVFEVTPEALQQSIDYVRANLRASFQAAKEAQARGNTASGRIEQTTANTLRDKALGGMELLGYLLAPPAGAVNWHEIISDENFRVDRVAEIGASGDEAADTSNEPSWEQQVARASVDRSVTGIGKDSAQRLMWGD